MSGVGLAVVVVDGRQLGTGRVEHVPERADQLGYDLVVDLAVQHGVELAVQVLEEVAEEVNLADFIRSLPGGFHEEVRERGSSLSTGQKQLINFARALAHNPQFLILDEATSSVDTETELVIRDALHVLMAGRTTLLIAHRLSTVRGADRIYVIDKGRVVEHGDHDSLVRAGGLYARLARTQDLEAV